MNFKKEWSTPRLVSLDNSINSGGSGVTYPENLQYCSGSTLVALDQFATFPAFGSVIAPSANASGNYTAPSVGTACS